MLWFWILFSPKKALGVFAGGMWRGGAGRAGIDFKLNWRWVDMGLLRATAVLLISHMVPGK